MTVNVSIFYQNSGVMQNIKVTLTFFKNHFYIFEKIQNGTQNQKIFPWDMTVNFIKIQIWSDQKSVTVI